ncbi:hypothetical protein TBK1r_35750 [Stieleria magnilauensis]|uniref:Uncharacterized protein n=1 Tax=Stieleria magnilauensis TaxID=2527963 RepID=A0ABX5XXQ9_9BACT|nr:hypothetical protein TBK1r_35750 [Planctomycetes bacterium TBK1r]
MGYRGFFIQNLHEVAYASSLRSSLIGVSGKLRRNRQAGCLPHFSTWTSSTWVTFTGRKIDHRSITADFVRLGDMHPIHKTTVHLSIVALSSIRSRFDVASRDHFLELQGTHGAQIQLTASQSTAQSMLEFKSAGQSNAGKQVIKKNLAAVALHAGRDEQHRARERRCGGEGENGPRARERSSGKEQIG